MENYKKKYENALNAARKFKNDCPSLWNTESNPFKGVFEELEDSNDDNIGNRLLNWFKDCKWDAVDNGTLKRDDIIAWLEKQDPKKHEEELEKAYRCADEVQYRKGYEDAKREIENQNEQKPTDKVEPKFKVGDFIINEYGFIMQIDGIDGNMYVYHVLDDNCILKYDITKTDKSCYLWTIQDAKDGNVLAVGSGSGIFIFDGTVEEGIYPFAYCGLTRYGFESYDRKLPFTHNKDIHPATKEQRDLLFQKMKEDGYEWDAEKKELKKTNNQNKLITTIHRNLKIDNE